MPNALKPEQQASRLNPAEVQVSACAPKMPAGLSPVAKKMWRKVVPQLATLGILTQVDETMLRIWCETYAEYIKAQETLDKEGLTYTKPNGEICKHPAQLIRKDAQQALHKLAVEFGMTSASRARLRVEKPADTKDPLAEMFGE